MAKLQSGTIIYGSANVYASLTVGANGTQNTAVSNNTGTLIVYGGAGVTGNVYAGAVYTDSFYYAANGLPRTAGAGATGSTGPTGTNGATGSTGPSGVNGATGSTGPAGTNGATGSTGPIGLTGATGANGASGVAGTNGATGSTGPTGSNGATGSTGPAGTNGATGTAGVNGATGSTGPAGTNGATGVAGTNGATGSTGPSGVNGATGSTGPAGTNGATGSAGPSGTINATATTNASNFFVVGVPFVNSAATANVANTIYYNANTGTLYANVFNSLSDVDLKMDVQTVEESLEKVRNLRGVSFRWKSNHNRSIGVIAQEVEGVLPELVEMGAGGYKTVVYDGFIGVLIEAIKEQQKQIDDLKRRMQ